MKLSDFFEGGKSKLRLRLPGWNEYAHIEFLITSEDPPSFGPWCQLRDVIPSPDEGNGAGVFSSWVLFPAGREDWERWVPPEGVTFEELSERFGWDR